MVSTELESGWQAAPCPPGAHESPPGAGDLDWLSASVPGTAAGALRDAGRWSLGEPIDLDGEDWWFRTAFEAPGPAEGEEVALGLDGIATLADVFLNGERLLRSESMFHSHEVGVGDRLRPGPNELSIRCEALAPAIAAPRRPRARWRTMLAANGLRFQRTMLLGRMPGPAPGPQAVGPWRPVRLVRRAGLALEDVRLRTRLDGDDGVLEIEARLRPLAGADSEAVEAEVELDGPSGAHGRELRLERAAAGLLARGELRVPGVERWWPHTHGEPALHSVRLRARLSGGGEEVEERRSVGFRELAPGPGPGHDPVELGLDPHVNGTRVFCRGAVWTPVDPIGLAPPRENLEAALRQARDAGMNMLRLAGTGAYESVAFHDLCDELGLLVWQDFMFANFDYPVADPGFRASVEREAREALARVAGRPSLAVLCGNSEVEQQAAMMGVDPALGRGELFGELLPALAAEAGADAPYLPSAPCGGERPFRTDAGVANYFGVGGYRRPLADARRAAVRFASECLALANLGEASGIDAPPARDAAVDWDFADVRDHYLGLLYGVDPGELREDDPERYLRLSRAVSGEVMATVFGEWRRPASPCGGGIVLWLRDLAPGAGWGLVDSAGMGKPALRRLATALAPRAVWMTDEGLNGIAVHVANDRPEPLTARLRLTAYRDLEHPVGEAIENLELAPHEARTLDAERLLGGFRDLSYAYRFGPPGADVVAAALEAGTAENGSPPLSQALHFPVGPPAEAAGPDELGVEAELEQDGEGLSLRLASRRLLHGLAVVVDGAPAADWLSLEPGRPLDLPILARGGDGAVPTISISALNLRGVIDVPPR